jgi:hypothetical protein
MNAEILWPSENYCQQVEQLRAWIGQNIYLIELHPSQINLGISITNTAYVLLAVLDFPRPDPSQGLAPHFLLLDDGRGVNLGRIARVTIRPFSNMPDDILYQDIEISKNILFAERRLSKELIAEYSRQSLAMVLGKPLPPAFLPKPEAAA